VATERKVQQHSLIRPRKEDLVSERQLVYSSQGVFKDSEGSNLTEKLISISLSMMAVSIFKFQWDRADSEVGS
jgi:hypothetical protein